MRDILLDKNEKGLGFKEACSKIKIIETEDMQNIIVSGKPYMSWARTDELAPKVAIVQLYQQGLAKQEDLAEIFKVHINTIYNYIATYRESGLNGLVSQIKGPKEAWKITPEIRSKILCTVLIDRVKEYSKIQGLLKKRWKGKVSIESIRQVLRENGFIEEKITTGTGIPLDLFEEEDNQRSFNFEYNSEGEVPFPATEKTELSDGCEKEKTGSAENKVSTKTEMQSRYSRAERKYLDDLECGEYNAYAGGLLFNALLEKYNYLPTIKREIDNSEGNEYTLGQLCLTLFHYDLSGFSSIRNYGYAYSEEFGLLLGRSSSPSRYTLQRFMGAVKEEKKGEKLMEEFGKEYLRTGLVKWGALYIDGHFQPYYGIAAIPMGYHGVLQKPLKGNYNFISADEQFNPWLFLIRSADEDLLEIIPELIVRAKKLGKEVGLLDEKIKELTVIFDREGFSSELFRTLSDKEDPAKEPGADAVKFISWAKNVEKYLQDLSEEEFKNEVDINYEIQKAEKIKYFEIPDGRTMKKYGEIRAIVIQSGGKDKRAMIYTNDKERKAEEIIGLMCRRWGEENLIKSLKLEHYLDYYPGKGLFEAEEKPEVVMVDNPEVLELKKEKAFVTSKLNELKVKFADEVLKQNKKKQSIEEKVQELKLSLLADLTGLESRITLLKQKISELPIEVRYEETHNGKKLFILDYEKKRFLDGIKIFVYHMQKQMISFLSKYYAHPKDIHSVLEMIIQRGAYVRLINGTLVVRLKRFMNKDIDFAARHLCEEVNNLKPKTLDKYCFPIHFEVE